MMLKLEPLGVMKRTSYAESVEDLPLPFYMKPEE